MNLEHIYKKSLAHQIINNDISHGMLHHAYMLVSTDNLKVNEFAKLMACEIFCANKNVPCFTCNECKKVMHKTHSDISFYPEKERLTVEESRKIASDIFVAPFESKHKVYIIENFDNATLQAQNALLKTLEEPSSFVVFILLVNNENNVAITIKSRVKTITERLLEKEDLRGLITLKHPKIKSDEIKLVSTAASGNLSVAKEFLENANMSKILSLASDIFFEMKRSSDVLRYVDKVAKLKNDTHILLDQMLALANNYAVFLTNRDGFEESSLKENFVKNESDYSIIVLEKITKHINTAYKKLASHCGQTAVFDSLFMSVLEEKFLYKQGKK